MIASLDVQMDSFAYGAVLSFVARQVQPLHFNLQTASRTIGDRTVDLGSDDELQNEGPEQAASDTSVMRLDAMKATTDAALIDLIRGRSRPRLGGSSADGSSARCSVPLLPPDVVRMRPELGSTQIKFQGTTIFANIWSHGTMTTGWDRQLTDLRQLQLTAMSSSPATGAAILRRFVKTARRSR